MHIKLMCSLHDLEKAASADNGFNAAFMYTAVLNLFQGLVEMREMRIVHK